LAAQASAECTYGSIEDWYTGSVTNMGSLFYNKPSSNWNIDISGWDTSSVTNMFQMFQGVQTLNNISIGDISSWDTSSVTTMEAMFKDTLLNPDLSAWNVGSVNDMKDMFYQNSLFNSDISNWDVSSVTDMQSMFYEAVEFNQPLANWSDKLDNVQFIFNMFKDAEGYSQDLSSWCLVPASDGGALLSSSGFWDGSGMSPAQRPTLDGNCATDAPSVAPTAAPSSTCTASCTNDTVQVGRVVNEWYTYTQALRIMPNGTSNTTETLTISASGCTSDSSPSEFYCLGIENVPAPCTFKLIVDGTAENIAFSNVECEIYQVSILSSNGTSNNVSSFDYFRCGGSMADWADVCFPGTRYPFIPIYFNSISVQDDPHIMETEPKDPENKDCTVHQFGEYKLMEWEGAHGHKHMITGHFFHGKSQGGFMDAISIECGRTTAIVTLDKINITEEWEQPTATIKYYDTENGGVELEAQDTGHFFKNSSHKVGGSFTSLYCRIDKKIMETRIVAKKKYGNVENGTARLDMVIPGWDLDSITGGLVLQCAQDCLWHLPDGPIQRHAGLPSGDCGEPSLLQLKSARSAHRSQRLAPDEGTRNAARRHSILPQKAHSMRKRMQKTMQSLKPMETQV